MVAKKEIKPITPKEVAVKRKESFPPEVIDEFNKMIIERWDGDQAYFLQKDVVKNICVAMNVESTYLYNKHYIDVEETYRKSGWDVKYDKPAYCEDFDANFTFSKRKRGPLR